MPHRAYGAVHRQHRERYLAVDRQALADSLFVGRATPTRGQFVAEQMGFALTRWIERHSSSAALS